MNPKEIKKQYYKLALQKHPDKACHPNATQDFQELKEAYECLMNAPPEIETTLLEQFIQLFNLDIDPVQVEWIMKSITKELGDYIALHLEDLPISPHLYPIIMEQLNMQVLILHPTLEDLFKASLYVYTYKDKPYYIPLWYHDMLIHIEDKRIVFHCIPDTSIKIDEYNHIHIVVHETIEEVWKQKCILVEIGSFKDKINASELRIQEIQEYRFIGRGIPTCGSMDHISDIVIHVYLK